MTVFAIECRSCFVLTGFHLVSAVCFVPYACFHDNEQAGDFELVEIVNDEQQDAMVQCFYHLQVHLCLI